MTNDLELPSAAPEASDGGTSIPVVKQAPRQAGTGPWPDLRPDQQPSRIPFKQPEAADAETGVLEDAPVSHPRKQTSAELAFDALRIKPEAARAALAASDKSGMPPSHELALSDVEYELPLPDPEKLADHAAMLDSAPGLKAYSERGPVEAASVVDHVETLTAMEYLLTGKFTNNKGEDVTNSHPENLAAHDWIAQRWGRLPPTPTQPSGGSYTPSMPERHVMNTLRSLYGGISHAVYDALSESEPTAHLGHDMINQKWGRPIPGGATGPDVPPAVNTASPFMTAWRKSLEENKEEIEKPIAGEMPGWRKKASTITAVAPFALGLTLAPEATVPAIFSSTYNDQRDKGNRPAIALATAGVTAAMSGVMAERYIGKAISSKFLKSVVSSMAKKLSGFANGEIAANLIANFGVTGGAFAVINVASALLDVAGTQLDHLEKNGKFDDNAMDQVEGAMTQALKNTGPMLIFALIPVGRQAYHLHGAKVLAAADAARVQQLTQLAQGSPYVEQTPEGAKAVIRHALSADATAPEHVHVDPHEFVKVAKEMGLDPQAIAMHATGDKQALNRALTSGEKLKMKAPEWLVDHTAIAEKLAEASSLHSDIDPITVLVAKSEEEAELPDHEDVIKNATQGTLDKLTEEAKKQAEAVLKAQEEEEKRKSEAGEAPSSNPTELPLPDPDAVPDYSDLAKEQLKDQTVAQISSADYAAPAARALKSALFNHQRAIDELAKAEQTAQQGIDAAISGHTSSTRGLEKTIDSLESKFNNRNISIPAAPRAPTTTETGLHNTSQPGKPDLTWAQSQKANAGYDIRDAARANQTAQDRSVAATKKTVGAGEYASRAEAAIQTKDINDALEAHRSDLEAEAAKADKFLSAQSSESIRKKTYAGGNDYGQAVDALLAAINKSKHVGDAGAFARLEDQIPLDFDLDKVQDILQNPREFSDLKMDEVREVQKAIKILRKWSADESKLYRGGAQIERADEIQDLSQRLERMYPKADFTRDPKSALKQAHGLKMQWDAEKADPGTLLAPITGKGNWAEGVQDRFRQARLDEAIIRDSTEKALDIPKELKELALRPAEGPQIDDPLKQRQWKMNYGDNLRQRDLWTMATKVLSQEGQGAMSRGLKLDPVVIDNYLREHIKTKAEWDFINSIVRHNEGLGQKVVEARAERSGVPMDMKIARDIMTPFGKVKGGYAPFKWFETGSRVEVPEPGAGGKYTNRNVPDGFTKAQSENFSALPNIKWEAQGAHYADLAHYVTHDGPVRDVSRMFSDANFKNLIERKLGPSWYDNMKNWLDVAATGRAVSDAQGQNVGVKLIQTAGSISKHSAFTASAPMVLGQATHMGIAAVNLGIKPWRIPVGIFKSLEPSGNAEAMTMSKVVPARAIGYGRQIDDQFTASGGFKLSGLPGRAESLSKGAYSFMDHLNSKAIWHMAKYDFQCENPTASEEEANLAADRGVERTMPGMGAEQKSTMANSKVLGSWMMVTNFPNKFSNMQKMLAFDRDSAVLGGASPVSEGLKYRMKLVGMTGFLVSGAYLMGSVGASVGKQLGLGDDADELQKHEAAFAQKFLVDHFYGDPLLRTVAEIVVPHLVQFDPDEQYWGLTQGGTMHAVAEVPALQNMAQIERDIKAVGKSLNDEDMSEATFRSLDALGRAIGVPPPALTRQAHGAYMLFSDDYGDFKRPENVFDKASYAAYGPKKVQTPLNDLGSLIHAVYNHGASK